VEELRVFLLNDDTREVQKLENLQGFKSNHFVDVRTNEELKQKENRNDQGNCASDLIGFDH
jgi:hypothetical protein